MAVEDMAIAPPNISRERGSMLTYSEMQCLPAVVDHITRMVDKVPRVMFPPRCDHHVLKANRIQWSPSVSGRKVQRDDQH